MPVKYMPTFRARQQEILVLSSFDFGNSIYPCVEIVKEFDRDRKNQKLFEEIYSDLINNINAQKVFLDLPMYLKESGSMQEEILGFSRGTISNRTKRTNAIKKFAALNQKVIPVISSFIQKTGEANTLRLQANDLRPDFVSIAYRLIVSTFDIDWQEVTQIATTHDYIILDLDIIAPYPTSPVLRKIVQQLNAFNTCPIIVLRSAINTDIQNVSLVHGNVIYEADNSIVDTFKGFHAIAFGDYGGIKKDDLSAGGTISPGFIYYDAVEKQYYGFKAGYKSLDEFENTIVPDVIASQATVRMLGSGRDYLVPLNWGWNTLNNINAGGESGKSQAKFKRIAMEHYLHCIRVNINAGDYN